MSSNEELIARFKAQRSCAFSIVLNDSNDGIVLKSTNYIYKSLCCASLPLVFLAVIKHDKDYNEEIKQMKTLHYHVVLVLSSSARVGTIINTLIDVFRGLNENQISIEKCSSVSSQVRYLIHLDDYDKFQYNENDILTNNREQVDYYLKEIKKINDVNDIIAIVREYKNLIDIIRVLGVDNYRKYRFVIKDLRDAMFY